MVVGTRAATEREPWQCRSLSRIRVRHERGLCCLEMQLAWPIISIIVTGSCSSGITGSPSTAWVVSSSTNPRSAAPAVCCITDQPNIQLPKKKEEKKAVRAGGSLPKAVMPPLSRIYVAMADVCGSPSC